MDIKSAKYVVGPSGVKIIQVILNGQDNIHLDIPPDPSNIDYKDVMEQVDAGTITIEEAD